jgi:hypothetical protein
MLILLCVLMCAVTQVAGLALIAHALKPEKTAAEVRESAMLEPTISTDYGGLV